MKGEKTTTKTMVSSVTALVLFLLVSWAAVQARQVLNNSDMNGCTSGEMLTSWTGTGSCGGPCSKSPESRMINAPLPNPNNCAAYWDAQPSVPSQALALTPGSEAPGLFDFEAFFGCYSDNPSDTCTFSLTIAGQSITLSGTTMKFGTFPDSYTPSVTATGIRIDNPNAVVSINCVITGIANCYATRVTLTFVSLVSGDPHFVGLDGQIFDMIGKSGSAYALLSDEDVMVCVSPLSVPLFLSFSAI